MRKNKMWDNEKHLEALERRRMKDLEREKWKHWEEEDEEDDEQDAHSSTSDSIDDFDKKRKRD